MTETTDSTELVRGAVDFPTLKSLVESTRKTGFSKLL